MNEHGCATKRNKNDCALKNCGSSKSRKRLNDASENKKNVNVSNVNASSAKKLSVNKNPHAPVLSVRQRRLKMIGPMHKKPQ